MSKDNIDLFILDTATDGIDVFEVTKKIKSDHRLRLTPIIITANENDGRSRARSIEAGCDDFLPKPYDRTEVQTRVDTILKLSSSRAALEGQAKFDSLFDYMEDGVVLLDGQLKIIRLNEKARDLLHAKDLRNALHFPEYIQKIYNVHYEGDLARSMKSESLRFDIERPETEILRPLILEVRSNVIKSAFRDISGIIVTLDDVTDVRNKAFKEEEFLNFISHKLRTPLAIVNKNATLLHKNIAGSLTADQKVLIQAIFEKSSELVGSFEKLIQFMAVKNRKADLFNESIEAGSLMKKCLENFVKREKKKKIVLDMHLEDPDPKVLYDKKHFEVVLQNLFENAVKFSDKDVININAGTKTSRDFVEIFFKDDGPGIPPEERENIFRPFYQVDKNRTGNVCGTGLGLAIVQYLVSAQGGIITVDSEIGKYTFFSFTIPLTNTGSSGS